MRFLGRAAALCGIVLFTVCLGTTVWQLLAPPPEQMLPALTLTALSGVTEELGQTSMPTVVYLWTTDCGACAGEFSLLADAARSARYGAFRYLFVNQGNDEASIRRYLNSNGLTDVTDNVRLDPANRVYDALGAASLPASYFFREDGSLHEAQAIIARPDRLAHTLEPLLGRP